MYFVTGNANKFKEAIEIIPELEQIKIDTDEIQSMDITEIAEHKLLQAYAQTKKPCVVEDIGFYIEALNGFPGPLIKWLESTNPVESITKITHAFDNHRAQVIANLGYIDEQEHIHNIQVVVPGKVVVPRGDNGWGFDSIFQIEGMDKSVAELSDEEKNNISWRAQAFIQLRDMLGDR